MATTLASLIDSARYDLIDYETGIVYTDEELLAYLNRMFEIMDSTLAALDSDLTKAQDSSTFSCTVGQSYVDISTLNSGNFSVVTEVWISTDEITQVPLNDLLYKQKVRSGNAKPQYWCLWNQNLYFQQGADDTHTLIIDYHKTTGTKASTDNMPYFDTFNEFFREQLVMHTKSKRLGSMSQGDAAWNGAFKRIALAEVVKRNFVRKPYVIKF